MARWIFNNRKTATLILFLLFILDQVIIRYTSDMVDVLVTTIYMCLVTGFGIYLTRYKIAQMEKGSRF